MANIIATLPMTTNFYWNFRILVRKAGNEKFRSDFTTLGRLVLIRKKIIAKNPFRQITQLTFEAISIF